MDTASIPELEQLLEEAAHCRRLARGPMAWQLAERLEMWAGEYERRAAELIRCAIRPRPPARTEPPPLERLPTQQKDKAHEVLELVA